MLKDFRVTISANVANEIDTVERKFIVRDICANEAVEQALRLFNICYECYDRLTVGWNYA